MTTIKNITVRLNPVKAGQKLLRNFLPFFNTYDEVESDCSQQDETAYLLRSAENKKRLLESIAQVDSGRGTIRELIE